MSKLAIRAAAVVTLVVTTAVSHAPIAFATEPTETAVSGIWATSPCAITSFDVATSNFTCTAVGTWSGTLTGVSNIQLAGHVDVLTGYMYGTVTESFVGTYDGDHSTGTLTLNESFTVNGDNWLIIVESDIITGSGDPTFGCSSGHITSIGSSPEVMGYGSYSGTWRHGCA